MWAGGFVLLAAVVAGVVVAFPHPGKRAGEKTSPGGDLVVQGKPVAFAPRQDEVLQLARQFVATAVARKNVASSFDLVCPDMKDGYTRQRWAKGNIPVVPFPVFSGKWRVSYSLADEVDLQVALYAIPTPSRSGDFGSARTGPSNPFGIGLRNPKPLPHHASNTWLLVPAVAVGGVLILVLAFFGIRGIRGRRAYAAYVRERQMSSSRPS
jgi:hypothetical protein